jgi:hypothetical protein
MEASKRRFRLSSDQTALSPWLCDLVPSPTLRVLAQTEAPGISCTLLFRLAAGKAVPLTRFLFNIVVAEGNLKAGYVP